MATINHGSGADIIVPSNNGTTYRGLAGDDTYIISNSIAANAAITIVDTSGANKIQLVDGLSVSSSKFAADAVQLTLSNGAVVTINGASNFTYDVGGNATTGTSGSSNTLAQFASAMGVATLPSSGSTDGSSDITIANNGVSGSAAPTFTVSKTGSSVDEGSAITFTITASSAVSADTSFSWTVIGDSNGATVDKAATSDIDVLSGTATIASGATSTTFDVTAASDSLVEGIEGIKVSVFDSNSAALSSDVLLINNSGSSATSQSFSLTTGVNEFTGGSGNDTFDASTNNSLNDFDVLDGGEGSDTAIAAITTISTGKSITPQLSNVEKLQVTNTDVDATLSDDDLSIELSGISGLTDVANVASNEDINFNNLGNTVDLEIKSAQGITTVNYDLAALSGAADSMTITLKGTNSTTIAVTDDGVAATAASSVLESVTISSLSVPNTLADLQLDGVATTTLNITGDKRLTLSTATDATVAVIDASGSTGGITLADITFASPTVIGSAGADIITATGTGATESFTMGGGNDSVDFVNSFTGLDVYDGGDGTDTLIVGTDGFTNAGLSSTVTAGLSNVEVLSLTAAGTITLESDTSINTISIGTNTTDQTVNLNDGTVQAYTVNLTGDTDSDDTINNNSNVTLTVNAYPADIHTDTNVTGSAGTSDVLNLTSLASGEADFDANNDVFETINVVAVGTSIATTLDLGAYDTSGTAVVGATTVTIDASTLGATNTLVMSDAAVVSNMHITSGAGADDITLGTGADTVVSGGGNDSIVGTTGASNDISTGAGVDTITLSASTSEKVDAGAGNDIITAAGNLDALDTIDGGAGTDTITFNAGLTQASVIAGVSNVEVITQIGNNTITASGEMGGATTFNLTEDTGAHTLNLGTATLSWTKDTTVNITGQANTSGDIINATYSGGSLTVLGGAADFDSGLVITGSAGADELKITAGGATTADLNDVTKVETVTIVDSSTAGTNASLTLNENSAVATDVAVLTIDATSLDGGISTFDEVFTLVGNGSAIPLNVKSGGGADILTAATKNDTIDGGGGIDTIDGKGGMDNISGGAGNDIINLGSKTEFITAYGPDIIDGGAGTDTVVLAAAMNLVATQLATISNVEALTIPDGSDLTISDAVLAANPGLKFNFSGAGTLSSGEDTAGASLMSTSINVDAVAAGNLKLVGSSADDTFTFHPTETLTADDTIDGNAGSDIIYLSTQDDTDTTGEAVSGTVGASITNVEKVVITDAGADQSAGNAEVIINSGFTGLSLEVDGSSLDANPTNLAAGEQLTVTNNDNTKLTVHGGGFGDIITSSTGADVLKGNGGADTIKAGGGADIVEGGAGADALWGEAGLDSIDGGAGNDTINVSDDTHFKTSGGVETVNGGDGIDTLDFDETGQTLTLTAPELSQLYSIEKITLTGVTTSSLTFGNETFTNNGVAQLQITTTTGNAVTTIDGSAVTNGSFLIIDDNTNANNDILTGGSGDDIFRFGDTFLAATDVITGNGGTDTIQLDNDDAVSAALDFDVITTVEKLEIYTVDGVSAGGVTVTIAPDTDALVYSAFEFDFTGVTVGSVTFNAGDASGNDLTKLNLTITGGSGADSMTGSLGNDTISGGGTTTGDTLFGGSGNDSITGNSGIDTIDGEAGNDTLNGGAGNDILTGSTGNDTIDGGDGADLITGSAGADNLTGGAGKDTFAYTGVTESGGNSKDTITDFTQSTLNATTLAVVTAGDSIKITVPSGTFAAGTADSFIVSDKGDVNNAGEAASAMDNVKGSFVFSKDNDSLYIDFDGDSTLNADDYTFVLTGLDSFHGADLDFDITAQDQILTVTTLDGDDTITGGNGADIINTGGGADTIDGDEGNNTINSGAGNDIITGGDNVDTIDAGAGDDVISSGAGLDIVTGGTGDDSFNAGTAAAPATANRVVIKDFEDAGTTVGDTLTIDSSFTTVANETAGASSLMASIDVAQDSGAVTLLTGDADRTTTFDIIEILDATEGGTAALTADITNGNSVELFKYLGDGDGVATGLTVAAAADKFYILIYDGGEAFLYFADDADNDNTTFVAADILPIAHFDSTIAVGAFDATDFIMG